MSGVTIAKTIGASGADYSSPQSWEDGKPSNLTSVEKSAATTFQTASFILGETINFSGSLAVGKFLDTDSTGPGTGTYITYAVTSGNIGSSNVATGAISGAKCTITSGTPDNTGAIWQGNCNNEEFSGTGTQITFGGSTTSSTCYAHLTTAAGASFKDNANVQTNALRYNASNGAAIRGTSDSTMTVSANEQFNKVSKLQVSATGVNGRGISFWIAGGVLDCTIVEATYTLTSTTIGVLSLNGSTTSFTATNCLFIQRKSGADHIVGSDTAIANFYGCTFVAADDLATAVAKIFLSGASGTITVQNCGMFAGDSSKAIKSGSATYSFTTCYSDISGTTGVTQCTYSSEFQNVTDGTRDFRLKSGAAQIDTGTTDSTNTPTDIAGTTRPSGSAYDVGCWEFVASNPVTVTPPVASLTLTTFAPVIATPRLVTPPKLSLAITSYAPVIATPRVVTPPKLALTLTTFAPVIATPRLVTPPPASLTLTTFAPVIATPRTVTPPKLALTLTTYVPSIQTPRLMTPGKLSLTITTYVPTLVLPRTVTPPTLALAITSYAPTVLTPRVVTPGKLSLNLTTYAPRVIVPSTKWGLYFHNISGLISPIQHGAAM